MSADPTKLFSRQREMTAHWHMLNARLAAFDRSDPAWLFDAIADVYQTMLDVCPADLQEYDQFQEVVLAQGLDDRAMGVARGLAKVLVGAEEIDTLLDAARLLRALERNASEYTRYSASDLGEDLEADWITSDGRHYVIPRVTSLAPVDGKPFLRRALLHSRVLPTNASGFAVRLHRSSVAGRADLVRRERASPGRVYGAAVFPGLQTGIVDVPPQSFAVDELTGFEAEDILMLHMQAAIEDSCSAVVWPELTMPTANLKFLQQIAAQNALERPTDLRFLAAGSWHSSDGATLRNLCSVLDGHGETLFTVAKWSRYRWDGKWEAIAPGNEVHILIVEDELTVFAICKDFLDENRECPYRLLNVDIAIVPSMISTIDEVRTMRGHATTAQTMRVRFGTRTMVVAQPATPGLGADGQLMAFPAQPLIDNFVPIVGPWMSCSLEIA